MIHSQIFQESLKNHYPMVFCTANDCGAFAMFTFCHRYHFHACFRMNKNTDVNFMVFFSSVNISSIDVLHIQFLSRLPVSSLDT